jgi:hypothetical protein
MATRKQSSGKGRGLSGAGGLKATRNPSKGTGAPKVPKAGNTGNQGVPRKSGRGVGSSKTAQAVGKVTKGRMDPAVEAIGEKLNGGTKRSSGAVKRALGQPAAGIGAGGANSGARTKH